MLFIVFLFKNMYRNDKSAADIDQNTSEKDQTPIEIICIDDDDDYDGGSDINR